MSEREQKIRAAMLAVGLKSIEKLAQRADLGPSRVYRWVNGGDARFSAAEFVRLAVALDIDVSTLIAEEAA